MVSRAARCVARRESRCDAVWLKLAEGARREMGRNIDVPRQFMAMAFLGEGGGG